MNVVCLTDISPLSDTLIVKGEVLDKKAYKWVEVENKTVPANSVIRAGSVVEKTEAQYESMKKFNTFAPADTKLNFNLESVFSQRVTFFGSDAPLSEVLRSHGIHTLEQVVENVDGFLPLMDGKKKKGGNKIKAQEVIVLHVGEDQALALIAECKRVLGIKQ